MLPLEFLQPGKPVIENIYSLVTLTGFLPHSRHFSGATFICTSIEEAETPAFVTPVEFCAGFTVSDKSSILTTLPFAYKFYYLEKTAMQNGKIKNYWTIEEAKTDFGAIAEAAHAGNAQYVSDPSGHDLVVITKKWYERLDGELKCSPKTGQV